MGYGGGLLHSHVETYPEGSEQQQVTCYHHIDINNDWYVVKPREQIYDNVTGVEFVNKGDTVRLLHRYTGANLHSHPISAPLTKSHFEVSTYGNDTLGDENDYWVIEVINDARTKKTNR